MRGSVRTRITVVATLVVAAALIVGGTLLITLGRQALIDDVRETLTANLTETKEALDRGVITELGLLQLGVATDPFEATTRIADQICAPILEDAYGDQRLPVESFYYFEGISDATYFSYDQCVFDNDPYFEAVAGCEEVALERHAGREVTFAEFQEILHSEEFDQAMDSCLDTQLVIDQRVEEASAICQPVIDGAFDGLQALDTAAVEAASTAALSRYTACMRTNGVPDYPEVAVSTSDDGSVLSGVARSQVVWPSLDAVRESVDRVFLGVTVAVPLLIAGLGLLVWLTVGRSLRPVEAIRRRVAAIGASELTQRVPEPGGNDEVARLAETMNEMLDRLEDSDRRQRQFVSDASHELRSPITAIRAHMEVALVHPERFEVTGIANEVLEESLRMENLLEDLLLMAKADAGAIVQRSEPVNLGEIVLAETERFDTVDTSGVEPGRVTGDALGLRRVVRNLLDNAVRHAAAQVRVTVSDDAGEVVLTVEDDGPGIPPEDRKRVFERFIRLDEGRHRDAGGAGLGLAVVGEIVRGHRGTVTIEDGSLGGARFVVRIPRSPVVPPPPPPPTPPPS